MSYIDSLILPRYQGEPPRLAEEIGVNLFGAAQKTVFVFNGDWTALERLTWGLSSMALDSTKIILVIATPAGGNDLTQPARSSQRLGWLSHLLSVGKLEILGTSSLIDGAATLILEDSEGLTISVDYRESPVLSDCESSSFTAHLDWTVGNPTKSLRNLLRKLEHSDPEHPSAIKCFNLLKSVRPVAPPFIETFDAQISEVIPGFQLYAHQEDAVDQWEKRGWAGIFAMCTGSGKTIAALAGIVRLSRLLKDSGKVLPVVVVAVPKKILADQWVWIIEELFQQRALMAFGGAPKWLPLIGNFLNQRTTDFPRFVVTTYATFSSEPFRRSIELATGHGVLVADEMHNLASTRLRAALETSSEFFKYRLGLSATPDVEGNPSATRALETYFGDSKGNYCGTYELKDGINDGVLCQYRYYPLPAHLDQESGRRYLETLAALEANEGSGNSNNLFQLYNTRRDLLRKSTLPLERLSVWLKDRRDNLKPCTKLLVYCPPGYVVTDTDSDDDDSDVEPDLINLLEETTKIIASHDVTVTTIIGQTPEKQRRSRLNEFKSGEWDCLCAIGCLDEGVDVPAIERAVVLYSIDRERQFIQRRGRILRKDRRNEKKEAEIFDVVLLPPKDQLQTVAARQLLEKEMRRYREFAELALNREDADKIISAAIGADEPFIPI